MLNAVLGEDTGELMEMRHLMKNPKYRELWGKFYVNELGRLVKGIPGRVEVTNTFFSWTNKTSPTYVGKM